MKKTNDAYIAALKETRLLVGSRSWEHLVLDSELEAQQLLTSTRYMTRNEVINPSKGTHMCANRRFHR